MLLVRYDYRLSNDVSQLRATQVRKLHLMINEQLVNLKAKLSPNFHTIKLILASLLYLFVHAA